MRVLGAVELVGYGAEEAVAITSHILKSYMEMLELCIEFLVKCYVLTGQLESVFTTVHLFTNVLSHLALFFALLTLLFGLFLFVFLLVSHRRINSLIINDDIIHIFL